MGSEVIRSVLTVATAIIGVALLAVLVSRNANTSQVVGAAAGGFAQDLEAAEAPVTGGFGFNALGGNTLSGGADLPNVY